MSFKPHLHVVYQVRESYSSTETVLFININCSRQQLPSKEKEFRAGNSLMAFLDNVICISALKSTKCTTDALMLFTCSSIIIKLAETHLKMMGKENMILVLNYAIMLSYAF